MEKSPVDFIRSLGTAEVAHSGDDFFSHLTAVQRVLQGWGEPEPIHLAGLFHSIYGTEGFQDFSLDLSRRDEVKALIGERAEFTAYLNCVIDRVTLDETLAAPSGQHSVRARPEVGGALIPLTDQQLTDLITVHLADWLEQAERQAAKTDQRHGWLKVGNAWGYRRGAYRRMAEILGGRPLAMYDEVFAREPAHTRGIHQKVTPPTKYTVPMQRIAVN